MRETIYIQTPSNSRIACNSVRAACKHFQKQTRSEPGRYGIWSEFYTEEFDAQLEVFELSKYPSGKEGLTYLEQGRNFDTSVSSDDIMLYVSDICGKAPKKVETVSLSQSGDTLMYPRCPSGFEIILNGQSEKPILGFHVFWDVAQARGKRIYLRLPLVDEKSPYMMFPKCIVPTLNDALLFVQTISEVTSAPIVYAG